MKNEKMVKRLVVFTQLEEVLANILNETDEEYLFYQAECANGTPDSYLREVTEIGMQQQNLAQKMHEIQEYYECSPTEAVLLYRFTDAYPLIKAQINDKDD